MGMEYTPWEESGGGFVEYLNDDAGLLVLVGMNEKRGTEELLSDTYHVL